MKFSFFNTTGQQKPSGTLDLKDFLDQVQNGKWKNKIIQLRSSKSVGAFKAIKKALPAVSISGLLNTRTDVKNHTGLICIDIDKKDNPTLRSADLIDKDCIAQFTSCSGEGVKIIYKCRPVKTATEHRRIYDAVIERLQKKKINIKVDIVVKSIVSLQYVTWDENLFYFPKTKLVIEPLKPLKIVDKAKSANVEKDAAMLEDLIERLDGQDITENYEDWLNVMFALSYSLGEKGRPLMHKICRNYKNYSEDECDEKYDACLESSAMGGKNPITIATLFQTLHKVIPKTVIKHLVKKHNVKNAVGKAPEGAPNEAVELRDHVAHGMFLFKRISDKENTYTDLKAAKINRNAFVDKLKALGFFRHGKIYVQIIDNIVNLCDVSDIVREVTRDIECEGDYNFTYNGTKFNIAVAELLHLWREEMSFVTYIIPGSLSHWERNLLRDEAGCSYIPYLNGVVKITAKGYKVIPYKEIHKQIWKERRINREFKYMEKAGMFEEFFKNVTTREGSKVGDEQFQKAFWYFGYMLHCVKRESNARAWMLYDKITGNNGRTGKSLIGKALGKIRNVTVIDGKKARFDDRFVYQNVQPYTNIIFIDDPKQDTKFTDFFNQITGLVSTEKKGQQSDDMDDVKFAFASNWIMEGLGRSEHQRQFVTQLNDFYYQKTVGKKDSATPIVSVHGKEFFTEWDTSDWHAFDSFAVRALKYMFANAVPNDQIVGNAAHIRFCQTYSEDMFYDLCQAFHDNYTVGEKVKRLMVSREALALSVQNVTGKTFGVCFKISREWLQVIGFGEVEVTMGKIRNQLIKVYVSDAKFETLEFGPKWVKLGHNGKSTKLVENVTFSKSSQKVNSTKKVKTSKSG